MMNKKNFLKVMAIVLVLVLSLGVIAACNPKDDKDDDGKGTGTDNKTQTVSERDAFFDMMFDSASEIGDDMNVDLAEGKDVAINVGLTLTLTTGRSTALPIGVSVKGFIDRANATAIKFETAKEDEKEDAKWAWTGKYIDYDEDIHAGWDTVDKADVSASAIKAGNDSDELVKEIVAYDKDDAGMKDYERYVGTSFTVDADNKTVLDVLVTAQGIESLRLYFKLDEGHGLILLTIGGNKYKIDLEKLGESEISGDLEDYLFNKLEGILRNGLTLNIGEKSMTIDIKTIIKNFEGGNFDLNSMLTSVIKLLLGDKNLATTILSKNEDDTLRSILVSIFNNSTTATSNGEENIRTYLGGSTLDIKAILKLVGPMIFNAPIWSTAAEGNDVEYAAYVKGNEQQEMSAYIQLGGGVGNTVLGGTILNGGYIRLGFDKDETEEEGKVGKMDNFYVDIKIANINKTQNQIGIKLNVDELAFGNTANVAGITAVNEEDYGAFYVDAGASIDFAENLLDIILREDGSFADYTIKVGVDEFGIDKENNVLNVPKDLDLTVKGKLDLADAEQTKLVLKLTAGAADVATIQLYSNDGTSLVADVVSENKDLIPFVLDLVDYVHGAKDNTIFVPGQPHLSKNGDEWGFWTNVREEVNIDTAFTIIDEVNNNSCYIIVDDKYTLVSNSKDDDDNKVEKYAYVKRDGKYKLLKFEEIAAEENKYTLNPNYFVRIDKYAPYDTAIHENNAVLYKDSATGKVLAEDGYAGKTYVRVTTYEDAKDKTEISKLFENTDEKIYAYYANNSLEGISKALDKFFKNGKMKITGLHIYDLLYNLVLDKSKYSIYANHTAPEYETASSASEFSDGTTGKFSDLLLGSLMGGDKTKGLVPVISALLNYTFSNTMGTLTIGGDDAMSKIFDNVLYTYSYDEGTDPDGKEQPKVSIYSAIGNILPEGSSNLFNAWEKFESLVRDLVYRGVYLKGDARGNYLYFARGEDVVSIAEENLAIYANASSSTSQKAAALTALTNMGYVVIPTTVAGDYVTYPEIAFKDVRSDAVSYAYSLGLSLDCDETEAQQAQDAADAVKFKGIVEAAGFNFVEIEKAEFDTNKNKMDYLSYSYNVKVDNKKVKTTKYLKLVSRTIDVLKTEYEAKIAEGKNYKEVCYPLLRRGIAAVSYNESDVWHHEYQKVFADEAVMKNLDLKVEIYTEKSGGKLTKAGIRINIDDVIADNENTIDLYINFATDIKDADTSVDAFNTAIGFSATSILTPEEYGVLNLQLVDKDLL